MRTNKNLQTQLLQKNVVKFFVCCSFFFFFFLEKFYIHNIFTTNPKY